MTEPSNQRNQTRIKSTAGRIKTAFFIVIECLKVLCSVFFYIVKEFIIEIHALELLFIQMYGIYCFICQILFLTMCEIAILGDPLVTSPSGRPGITGLSALLFYNTFGYFIGRIKNLYQNRDSRVTDTQHLASIYLKWFLKIALEWAKAIAVVLCIRDQGITFQINLLYTIITFIYYLCTEKFFTEMFVNFASYCEFNIFDSMEHLYIPIICNVFVIVSATVVTAVLCTGAQATYVLFASYFILYLRGKDLYCNYVKALLLEKKTFASFRFATDKDIQKWDDICAVCLNRMSRAKITPCNHLFHPICLKQCLRSSLQCPLCKHSFVQ